MKTKICNGKLCKGKEKLLSEFGKDNKSKDGLFCQCKVCVKKYMKKYRDKNKEKTKKYNKEYKIINKEKLTKQNKIRYELNKEAISEQHKKYYDENSEKFKELSKKYNKEHPEKRKEYYDKNKTKIALARKQWCINNPEYNKKYQDKNKEKIKIQRKCHYENNKEEIKRKTKKYAEEHKEQTNKRASKRYKNDLDYKLKVNLRTQTTAALKGNKNKRTLKLLGCTIDELKTHLKSQFTDGMNWTNHGRGWNGKKEWHIDHIKPCSKFDLSKLSQQEKCFHYTNLQPLWAIDNLKKSNKY